MHLLVHVLIVLELLTFLIMRRRKGHSRWRVALGISIVLQTLVVCFLGLNDGANLEPANSPQAAATITSWYQGTMNNASQGDWGAASDSGVAVKKSRIDEVVAEKQSGVAEADQYNAALLSVKSFSWKQAVVGLLPLAKEGHCKAQVQSLSSLDPPAGHVAMRIFTHACSASS